jgi:hypothetical protein
LHPKQPDHEHGRISVTIPIEINLRVPDVSVMSADGPTRVSNREKRFLTGISVPVLPKVGEHLELVAGTHLLQVVVKRLDWRDDKGCFVVACQYARRSMGEGEYDGLCADLEWTATALIPTN